ncbi:hypothetical protein SESBI_17125 [Sesbania bispinosa]|nr:hypothetical protein SESBI_17125 [Sesbania bispinosa]
MSKVDHKNGGNPKVEKNNGSVTEIVTTSKLIDIKLDGGGENYVEWKYLVEVNLGEMGKDNYLPETCPDDPKATTTWKLEDKRILALLMNSVDRWTQAVITHFFLI